MSKMVFKKVLGHLVPADETAIGFVRKCKPGELVMMDGRRPRNIKHHRWLFKLLQIVCENTDRYPDVETLLFALKIATGYCEPFPSADGKTVYMKPKSISFESMDQEEFSAWSERVVKIVCEQIIPGTESAALRAEVESMLEPTY